MTVQIRAEFVNSILKRTLHMFALHSYNIVILTMDCQIKLFHVFIFFVKNLT